MYTVSQETIRPVNKTRKSQNINRHYWQKRVSEWAGISSGPEESSVFGLSWVDSADVLCLRESRQRSADRHRGQESLLLPHSDVMW